MWTKVEVDVAPAQGTQLAQPQPRERRRSEDRRVLLVLRPTGSPCDTGPMRIVVGLTQDGDVDEVADALSRLGARHVQGPAPSLPGVLVADFAEREAGDMVKRLVALPGVRYAEPDEMRTTLD